MDLDRDNKRAQRKRKRVPEDAEEDDGWQVKPDAEPQTLQDFGKEVAETAAANCLLGARVDCSSCAPSSIADLSVRARQIADKIEKWTLWRWTYVLAQSVSSGESVDSCVNLLGSKRSMNSPGRVEHVIRSAASSLPSGSTRRKSLEARAGQQFAWSGMTATVGYT